MIDLNAIFSKLIISLHQETNNYQLFFFQIKHNIKTKKLRQ